jgi:hypothetical protein
MVLNKQNDILKIIAIVTMLVDHIGVLFFPDIMGFRTVGRIAFPIFAFFLANGFRYSSNRLNYLKRLGIVALISQVPYMFLNLDFTFNYYGYNVIFLFMYGIGMLYIYEQMIEAKENFRYVLFQLYLLVLLFIICLPGWISLVIPGFYLSYGSYGLVLILLFYTLYDKPLQLLIIYPFFSFLFAYLQGVQILYETFDISYLDTLFNVPLVLHNILNAGGGLWSLDGFFFQSRSILGVIAVVIFALFEYRIKLPRYLLYIFYPAHITILVLLKVILS